MEFCKQCECKCKPIDKACVSKFSDIKDPTILSASHYEKATNDIDSLIGDDCADELCAALKKAAEDAETNGTTILEELPDLWKNIIQDKHFKMWYANRLLWHWLNGASISELSESGLVTTRNNDDDYKNDYEHATEAERKRMQQSAKFYSDEARGKFNKRYWHRNKHQYDCAEQDCGCSKYHKCEEHCDKPPRKGGIGIVVI